MSSLREWNAENGEVKLFESPREKKTGFAPELDTSYPVKITDAKVVTSSRGDKQVELSLDYLATEGGDEVLGKRREWLTLPWQDSDKKMSNELRERVTQRRILDVLRILSAAAPQQYSLYDKRLEPAHKYGKTKFIDFDGEEMTEDDFAERTQEIQTRCVKFAEELRFNAEDGSEVEKLIGTELYLTKATNAKDERYPYSNWYARRPNKGKVYQQDAAPF